MSSQPPFVTSVRLLLTIPLIWMVSSCGPANSSGQTQSTAFPTLSTTAEVGTALARLGPTLEASLAQYQPQSACDLFYMPLRKGATWTYLAQGVHGGPSSSEVITVAAVQGDLGQAIATVTSQYPDAQGVPQTSAAKYTCDSTGVRLVGPGLPFDTLLPQLLPVDQLVGGTSWAVSNPKTIVASAPCWGGGTYTRLSHYEVRGIETIDLPAEGPVAALRIDEVNPLSPLATPSAVCAQVTANSWWLVPGRGLVRHEAVVTHLNSAFDYTLVTDLVSETLP